MVADHLAVVIGSLKHAEPSPGGRQLCVLEYSIHTKIKAIVYLTFGYIMPERIRGLRAVEKGRKYHAILRVFVPGNCDRLPDSPYSPVHAHGKERAAKQQCFA